MIPYYYCMYVVISIVVKITGLSILTCTRVTRAIATRRQQVGMAIERFVCGVHVEACIFCVYFPIIQSLSVQDNGLEGLPSTLEELNKLRMLWLEVWGDHDLWKAVTIHPKVTSNPWSSPVHQVFPDSFKFQDWKSFPPRSGDICNMGMWMATTGQSTCRLSLHLSQPWDEFHPCRFPEAVAASFLSGLRGTQPSSLPVRNPRGEMGGKHGKVRMYQC